MELASLLDHSLSDWSTGSPPTPSTSVRPPTSPRQRLAAPGQDEVDASSGIGTSRRSRTNTSSGNLRCGLGGTPGPNGSSSHFHGGRSQCYSLPRRSRVSLWRPSRRYRWRGSRCSVILVFRGIGASAVQNSHSRSLDSALGARRVGQSLEYRSLLSRSKRCTLCGFAKPSGGFCAIRGRGNRRMVAAASRPRLCCL